MATRKMENILNVRRRRRAPQPLFIKLVTVTGLFGQIDYENLTFDADDSSSARVSVIFGDNGAGKTTLLHLIYSILSPQTGIGLRGYIAKTPFKSITLRFSDNSQISVNKINGLDGSYRYNSKNFDDNIDVIVESNEDRGVHSQNATLLIEAFLKKLDVALLFVDHERYIRSTYDFLSELSGDDPSDYFLIQTKSGAVEKRLRRERSIQFPLEGIVDAVNRTFRAQAFRQGATGDQNASAVYLEISRALIRPKKRGPSPDKESKDLGEILADLEAETASLTRHGLLSTYPFQELRHTYEAAPKAKRSSVADVLTPFIQSVQRRVIALQPLHELLTAFEEELNKYLTNKSAEIHVLHGFVIKDSSGLLNLDQLSSGEKQLVFLLSAAVVARFNRSLILIDEPELSLNYKWQRMIAGSLSRLSSRSTQFIMASHSIEIISRYGDNAIELRNTSKVPVRSADDVAQANH